MQVRQIWASSQKCPLKASAFVKYVFQNRAKLRVDNPVCTPQPLSFFLMLNYAVLHRYCELCMLP
jgi:hypothetical protein